MFFLHFNRIIAFSLISTRDVNVRLWHGSFYFFTHLVFLFIILPYLLYILSLLGKLGKLKSFSQLHFSLEFFFNNIAWKNGSQQTILVIVFIKETQSVNIQFAMNTMNLGNVSHEYLSWQNDSEEFQKEAQNVSRQFQKVRDEVMGQYGYDSLGKESVHTSNSTQEEYVVKTRARCDCECK